MQCNKCNSENTQRLEVVFENGTSNINTRSHSAGAGFGGAFGVGGATTTTSGTSQTVQGRKAAPPMKKPTTRFVFGIIISVIVLMSGGLYFIFGSLLIGANFYLLNKSKSYNKIEWPPLYKLWQECWLCHKCGNIYHHP